MFDKFDSGIGRRLKRAEQRADELTPSQQVAPIRTTPDPERPSLFHDVGAWIATWLKAEQLIARGHAVIAFVARPIVRAAPREDGWSPPIEPAVQRKSAKPSRQRAVPPPLDPYSHLRTMSEYQLVRYGNQRMPNAERLALEDELNVRAARAYENPPVPNRAELEARLRAEHEGTTHGGASFASTQSDDASLTRRH